MLPARVDPSKMACSGVPVMLGMPTPYPPWASFNFQSLEGDIK